MIKSVNRAVCRVSDGSCNGMQVKQTRCHAAWMAFLKDFDQSQINRNEWNEKSEIRERWPQENSIARFQAFAQLLRNDPNITALIAKLSSASMSKKLKVRCTICRALQWLTRGPPDRFDASRSGSHNPSHLFLDGQAVLGADEAKEQRVLLETLGFSLFGNLFQSREFNRLRACVRQAFVAGFRSVSHPMLLFGSSGGSRGSTDAAGTGTSSSSSTASGSSHTPTFCLKLAQYILQRAALAFLSVHLREPLMELMLRDGQVIDPDPAIALQEQRQGGDPAGAGSSSTLTNSSAGALTSVSELQPKKRLTFFGRLPKLNSTKSSGTLSKDAESAIATAAAQQAPPLLHARTVSAQPSDGGNNSAADLRPNTMATRQVINDRRRVLTYLCDAFLARFTDATVEWPAQVLRLIGDVLQTAMEVHQGAGAADPATKADLRRVIIGSLLFDQCILPFITDCDVSGLLSEFPLTTVGKKNAKVLANVLSKVNLGPVCFP